MNGGHRNSTAQRLAARARRRGGFADLQFATNADHARFAQNWAAVTYCDAAITPDERRAAQSYISLGVSEKSTEVSFAAAFGPCPY